VSASGRLLGAIAAEVRLVRELRATLLEQRAALSREDRAALAAAVQRLGRTLLALRDTRRERSVLAQAVTGRATVTPAEVGRWLEGPAGARWDAAVGELGHAAAAASRDLADCEVALGAARGCDEFSLHRMLIVPGAGDRDAAARPRPPADP
jgi:hypothetical protein